ncbi:MAG: zinc ABC transporter substrate-binding protein [Gemmobacter sp.]|nr:zinc ABC transporter substrate-binding protein [Gemmobacter sp.]
MRPFLSLACCLLPLPVMAEVPRVVTDIPPVHALVAMVMGDLGTPDLLLDRGANAHSFALRPSQAAGLQAADLVVWVGPGMTPWLDRALDGIGTKGHRLELLAAPGTLRRDYGDHAAHDHAEGHADHDDHAGHDDHKAEAAHDAHDDHDDHDDHDHHAAEAGHDDHAHAGLDPHAWLDPANALHWLDLIAAELAEQDPANAAAYAANAAAAKDGITALDARLAADLAPLQSRPFVVFHDAYGYFAGHYGLTLAGSVAMGDAATPGAGHLQDLRARMTEGGILCAFPEAQHDPKMVQTLVEGTGVKLGTPLDPSGSSLEPGPGLYAALLTGLSDSLRACLAD